MPHRTVPPGQLDIPLVWEERPDRDEDRRGESQPRPSQPLTPFGGTWRLWLAFLADAALIVLAVTALWGVAVARVGALAPGQIGLASSVGLEVATVVSLGCFWGWRASPGMLLAGLCFARPIAFGRTVRLWLCWLVSLPVLGVPLLLRRRGESVAERLAGGSLSYRSSPADA
jgi:hypothetical protein